MEQDYSRPERVDFSLERADFRPERAWGGWTDGWMDKRKTPCVLQFYSLTVLQFYSSSSTVLQFYSSTVYSSTVRFISRKFPRSHDLLLGRAAPQKAGKGLLRVSTDNNNCDRSLQTCFQCKHIFKNEVSNRAIEQSEAAKGRAK